MRLFIYDDATSARMPYLREWLAGLNYKCTLTSNIVVFRGCVSSLSETIVELQMIIGQNFFG
jgi:hypothetical protein